ncbi:BnaC04g29110D [Brassica napus]|uniref:BnaC04g29110D protein n=1 Tax=Brassica napus TaxID=3708 RepID=A0A078FED4_BRANA|nr:BnaC04g29110D [Brassica napus]
MIKMEYTSFFVGKRKYTLHNFLLKYGKGIVPPHGRTQEIWNLDLDRLYVPIHVQGVGCVIKTCSSYCQGSSGKIPKDFDVTAYSVSYVPVGKLNKSALDCGVYALKFI